MTFAEEFELAAKEDGSEIQTAIIGEFGWGHGWGEVGYTEESCSIQVPWEKRGIVLSWPEAREWLNYDYGTGFGRPECHAVYAWSASHVYFVVQYDGATSIQSISRAAIDCRPNMAGE